MTLSRNPNSIPSAIRFILRPFCFRWTCKLRCSLAVGGITPSVALDCHSKLSGQQLLNVAVELARKLQRKVSAGRVHANSE